MTSLIDWEKLETSANGGLYLKTTVKNQYCDGPVPRKFVTKYLKKIYGYEGVKDWILVERKNIRKDPKSDIKYHWHSEKEDIDLYYIDGLDNTILILEKLGEIAAIVGLASGHSYIETPLFSYGNSDGSTNNIDIDTKNEEPTAKMIFEKLIFYYLLYPHDLIH